MEQLNNGLFIKQERFEVLAILRDIYKQRTPMRIANQQQQFFYSQLLSVGAGNIVFDCSDCQQCTGGQLQVVIEGYDAKIEFLVDSAERIRHQENEAFSAQLPKELKYIQRRRQPRITTPYWRDFYCHGDCPDGSPLQLRIHDISVGGVGLRLDGEVPSFLHPGFMFHKVQLNLDSYGTFKVNMELLAISDDHDVSPEDEEDNRHFSRLSCRFTDVSPATMRKLQSAVYAFDLDFNKKKKR
ncbi:flagellar brake protein [Serratia rhizosphaerae]|uniref:flagellar brake protein n=1 Tax=Serratia sp. Tan611 TaxID=2773264 RepID=UPI000DA29AE4|nr:flagellar brake protein [Serratia sp. Tan611]MBU3892353.1 flagellar brake protein [Serratia rubidaea]MCA4823944.1 flagellar brake protein [Serratia rubidaea]QPT11304.1 flagellar brake protein [Serratia rubidaea]CAE1145924.1 Flagellar brake protein YcgR [Serratia sp. Tan611]SQJ19951.1 Cyclic di-GMP binding protein YcgR [Serratia rubidaea]